MNESLEQWFTRAILVHEQSLTRYLLRAWANRDEVADLRQEIYVKVYEWAKLDRPTSPKAFLFTSARHLMTDRLRRSRIIFIGTWGDLDALNVLIDEISPEQSMSGHQDLARLARAFDSLPPKCRAVMWLRKIEQLSQKEVAERLGVRAKAVEKQVARGMRLLASALYDGGDGGVLPGSLESADRGSGHG